MLRELELSKNLSGCKLFKLRKLRLLVILNSNFSGTIHIWYPWKLSNFQDPPPSLSTYVQNSSTSLTLDVQFQTNPPPRPHPSPNDNQSIKKKHNPRMTAICYQVFPSAFVFSMNSLILPGFPLTSFNLAEANLVPKVIFKN